LHTSHLLNFGWNTSFSLLALYLLYLPLLYLILPNFYCSSLPFFPRLSCVFLFISLSDQAAMLANGDRVPSINSGLLDFLPEALKQQSSRTSVARNFPVFNGHTNRQPNNEQSDGSGSAAHAANGTSGGDGRNSQGSSKGSSKAGSKGSSKGSSKGGSKAGSGASQRSSEVEVYFGDSVDGGGRGSSGRLGADGAASSGGYAAALAAASRVKSLRAKAAEQEAKQEALWQRKEAQKQKASKLGGTAASEGGEDGRGDSSSQRSADATRGFSGEFGFRRCLPASEKVFVEVLGALPEHEPLFFLFGRCRQ
jgi:hypothetical protein